VLFVLLPRPVNKVTIVVGALVVVVWPVVLAVVQHGLSLGKGLSAVPTQVIFDKIGSLNQIMSLIQFFDVGGQR